MRELRNLDGLRGAAEDPVVGLLLTAASRHVTADLSFVDDAESVLLGDGGKLLTRLGTSTADQSSSDPGSTRPGPVSRSGAERAAG